MAQALIDSRSADRPEGAGKSVSLTIEKEAVIVDFRRHTLPLDDCLYVLQPMSRI